MSDQPMLAEDRHLFSSKNAPIFLIAGPCVIESEALLIEIAGTMNEVTKSLGISYVFKASFDKANRTSLNSFRGIGIDKGLQALAEVKKIFNIPLLTDIHAVDEIEEVAQVVDILQIPAFLCRQTDLLVAAAKTGKTIQVKKGQFMAPSDMKYVAAKIAESGNHNILLCERGTSFGYHDLVVDMRGLKVMGDLGYPVVFDVTHSVQSPGGLSGMSGGQRHMIPTLARAAIAAKVSGLFMETHPNPDKALSDGPNSWPLSKMKPLLSMLVELDYLIKSQMIYDHADH